MYIIDLNMSNKFKIEAPKNVDLKDDVGEIEVEYPLMDTPFSVAIIGSVRGGKSLLWSQLLTNPKFPYKDIFQVKILISGTALNDKMLKNVIDEDFDFIFDTYSDSLLEEIVDMIERDVSDTKYIIVFEDIIGAIKIKRTGSVDSLTALVTKYRHISNGKIEGKLSLVIVTQYFKYLNAIMRLNMSAYFLMGNSSEGELKKYSNEFSVFGGSSKKFIENYKLTKKVKYDFTYLNMKSLSMFRNFETLIWSDDNDKETNKLNEEIKEE